LSIDNSVLMMSNITIWWFVVVGVVVPYLTDTYCGYGWLLRHLTFVTLLLHSFLFDCYFVIAGGPFVVIWLLLTVRCCYSMPVLTDQCNYLMTVVTVCFSGDLTTIWLWYLLLLWWRVYWQYNDITIYIDDAYHSKYWLLSVIHCVVYITCNWWYDELFWFDLLMPASVFYYGIMIQWCPPDALLIPLMCTC